MNIRIDHLYFNFIIVLGFLHLPRMRGNYSHMEAINNIIIIKWMDKSTGINLVQTIIESRTTTRSNE